MSDNGESQDNVIKFRAGGLGAVDQTLGTLNAQPNVISGSASKIEHIDMANPTREEIDAKLATTEARIETKLTSLEGKFDLISSKIDFAIQQMVISQDVTQKTAERAETVALRTEEIARSSRWNMVFLALAVVASVIATLGFGAQMFDLASNLFQAGAK